MNKPIRPIAHFVITAVKASQTYFKIVTELRDAAETVAMLNASNWQLVLTQPVRGQS